jgi:hypothetical protein
MRKFILLTLSAMFLSAGALLAVPFTLRNNTPFKIPLSIPGVMNPNLSPLSNSGVDLAVGQKVFFYVKKKKYLLLEVTEALKDKKLDVGDLIALRRKELGV